jgi:hypothetical protein
VTPHLLHCIACDDVRYVTAARTFCACGRSSARVRADGIVLIGPGRIFKAGRQAADVRVIRPAVAVAM